MFVQCAHNTFKSNTKIQKNNNVYNAYFQYFVVTLQP